MLFGKFAFLLSLAVLTVPVLSSGSEPGEELHRRTTNTDNRCSPGTYSSSGKSPCSKCPAGSYSKDSGKTSCTLARPGYYIPSSGTVEEKPCQAGTYSPNSGSTSCKSCPAGFMCPSSAIHTPQQCSPGRYSKGGAVTCSTCAPGTFNNIHQATSCCLCAAGWFLANGGNTNCQQCPNQTPYSNPGASAMNQCSSKPGLYAPSKTSNQGKDGSCPLSLPVPSHHPKREWVPPKMVCQPGFKACPIHKGAKIIDYDCVDVQNSLESCGGCVTYSLDGGLSPDGGRDCSAIPSVDDVFCSAGRCQIGSCRNGHVLSPTKDSCVPVSNDLYSNMVVL